MVADPFVLSHVRRLPLFAYLSPEQLDAVASAFQQARFAPGEALFRQGENSQALYILVSGGARILYSGPDRVEREQGIVPPGAYIGEESLFLTERRDVSLVATQDTIALFLPKARFDTLLEARPDIRPVLNLPKPVMDNVQAQRQRGIRPDEMTLLLTRRHPWAFAGKILRAVLLFVLLVALALVSTQIRLPIAILPLCIGAAAFILPLLLALYYFFEWRNDYFIITNQRVIHEERLLLSGQEQRDQALLGSIQNVNVLRRGAIAEVIGFGDVVVNTAGNQRPVTLDMVPNPTRIQQVIFEQIQRSKEQESSMGQGAIRAQVHALLNGSGSTPSAPTTPVDYGNTPRQAPGVIERVFRAILPRGRTVDGDRITYRKHWIVLISNLWKPVLSYLLLAALIVVRLSGRVGFVQSVPGLVALGIVLFWLAITTFWLYWEYADWHDDFYILDSKSIIDIKRRPLWLNEIRIQAGLPQIQNVSSRIGGVWGQLFNYGSVLIQTAAEHGAMEFRSVSNPNAISEEILQRVQRRSETQTTAEQDEQRRMMAEYLSAYHQATRSDPPPQAPPTPAAPLPSMPATGPLRQTQPMRPVVPTTQPRTPPPPASNPTRAVPPPQAPEMPPNLDQTQARSISADTQPFKPPKPPDVAP